MVDETLAMLGKKATDKITGFSGVVTSIGFDLYGCVQAVLHPGLDKDGQLSASQWFDVARLEVSTEPCVMVPPSFKSMANTMPASYDKGPAEKPIPNRY